MSRQVAVLPEAVACAESSAHPATGQTWSISELAREFGITTRTIRFYEERGLLEPERHGLERRYRPRERTRLRLALRGKRLGFSLAEVAEMLDLYDAPDGERDQLMLFVERMQVRRAELARQREEIDELLGELDLLEHRCRELLDCEQD